ncbi:hypothetical protein ABIA30_001507 [Mycobacterium sp. MAA66]
MPGGVTLIAVLIGAAMQLLAQVLLFPAFDEA